VPRSRIRGGITPLPQYVFMSWWLVNHRDNFTFTFFWRSGRRTSHCFYDTSPVPDEGFELICFLIFFAHYWDFFLQCTLLDQTSIICRSLIRVQFPGFPADVHFLYITLNLLLFLHFISSLTAVYFIICNDFPSVVKSLNPHK